MSEYYYTIASLPMLMLNQDPPISIEYFLETCRYTINEKDLEVVENASLISDGRDSNKCISKWYAWDRALRNELVKMRAQKTGIDAAKYLHQDDTETGVFDAAREAFNASNPAAGEDILNSARWRYLDELESGHNFDLDKLIVYYLKLQLLHRKKVMNLDNGRGKYQEIYGKISDKIHQSYDGEL